MRRAAPLVGLVTLGLAVLGLSAAIAWGVRGRLDPKTSVINHQSSIPGSRGRLVYQVHCARCHGAEGHGDGPDAATLQPPPRDFASNHWRFSPTAESIRKVTIQGIPDTSMFGWGGSLPPSDLDAVVAHIRSLASTNASMNVLLKNAGFQPRAVPAPAPVVIVDDLDGGRHSLEEWRDKLTLLVFWGTSCAPCLEELPRIERLADEFRERGFRVVAVCADEADPAVVRRVLKGRIEHLSAYVSRDGMARLRYDVQTLPAAFLIDREGRLLGTAGGGTAWDGAAMRQLLATCLTGF